MSYQPFLIAGFQTGLETNLRPWLLPQDAFQNIVNGHVHNSVLQKRPGIEEFGWMVNASTETVVNITQANPGVVTLSGVVGLANGDYFQLRNVLGMTEVNNITYQIKNIAGATFQLYTIYGEKVDTSAFGAYGGGGDFFLVPKDSITGIKQPIMGIRNFIDNDGVPQIIIFNTQRGAIYNPLTQVFDPLDAADIFSGGSGSFISSASYGKTKAFSTCTFFFTNFNGDITITISPMRTYTTGSSTTSFQPQTITTGTLNFVVAAQFIFSIRSRLLILNTVENTAATVGISGTGVNFSQRMRWSRSFNPSEGSGVDFPWDEITPGNGGFIDAATSEKIISAIQLEDTIVVNFTNSVWLIEPTSDPAIPFRWIKVNSYRTCTAPYANIAHDNYVISFGGRGIVASSRNEVKRIDDKIEDFMMEEVNSEFAALMYSQRDFTERRSWTLFPSSVRSINPESDAETSNFALIRTEEEGAWSIYDVAMTDIDSVNGTNMSCLGYGAFSEDKKFDDFPLVDEQGNPVDFDSFSTETWTDFFQQSDSEVFLAGDQIGRILSLDSGHDDLGIDIDFEVTSAGWNPFAQEGKQSQIGYVDFYIDADKNTQFDIEFYCDDITSPYGQQTLNCLPNLGFIADIVNVTQANPVVVNAPGHGLATGSIVYIYGINGMIALDGGPYTITFVDENNFSIASVDSSAYPVYTGGGQVVERAFENDRCWKRAYAGGKGYQHYIKITNSGNNDVLNFHAFMPYFRAAGNRMIGG